MRMTNLTIERNFLYNVGKSEERLQKLQDMASSGMNFRRPQDDPVGVERAITLRNELSKSQHYSRNIMRAKAWMDTTEEALGELTTVLTRAQEIGLAGANGTTPPDARRAIAAEVRQLIEEVAAIRGRTLEGRPVLTGTQPTWRIGPDLNMTAGDRDGLGGSSETEALLDNATAYLTDLATGLELPALDAGGVQAALHNLSVTGDEVLSSRATNGARVTRLEMLESKMALLDIEYQRLLSNVEDVDITQVIVRLKSAEAAYQAALGAGARLIQPSLLDYLR